LQQHGLHGEDLVAMHGIGGLGHLGIQFARHTGFCTVAIVCGGDKEELAKDLGVNILIDTASRKARQYCSVWGGARAILASARGGSSMGEFP
jgi:D-arabinose 1-dehydrogenase-like Zn-dependent alcohol dehydrogenase